MDDNAERHVRVRRRVHFSAILPPSLICVAVIVFGIFLQAIWPLHLFPELVYVRLGLGISLYSVGTLFLVASVQPSGAQVNVSARNIPPRPSLQTARTSSAVTQCICHIWR